MPRMSHSPAQKVLSTPELVQWIARYIGSGQLAVFAAVNSPCFEAGYPLIWRSIRSTASELGERIDSIPQARAKLYSRAIRYIQSMEIFPIGADVWTAAHYAMDAAISHTETYPRCQEVVFGVSQQGATFHVDTKGRILTCDTTVREGDFAYHPQSTVYNQGSHREDWQVHFNITYNQDGRLFPTVEGTTYAERLSQLCKSKYDRVQIRLVGLENEGRTAQIWDPLDISCLKTLPGLARLRYKCDGLDLDLIVSFLEAIPDSVRRLELIPNHPFSNLTAYDINDILRRAYGTGIEVLELGIRWPEAITREAHAQVGSDEAEVDRGKSFTFLAQFGVIPGEDSIDSPLAILNPWFVYWADGLPAETYIRADLGCWMPMKRGDHKWVKTMSNLFGGLGDIGDE